MNQLNTGELEFRSFEESSLYFANLLAKGHLTESANTKNAKTYKSEIVELKNVSYSIPAGIILSDNLFHKPTPFWAISESISEILNLPRPIMERYLPDIMDGSYHIFDDRMPSYSYGERIHMFNQFANTFERLNTNPSSKRAYISIFQGFDTDLSKKDVSCTIGWNLSIRNDKLDIATHMRSWDFFAGNIYDVFLANMLNTSFVSWLKNSNLKDLESGRLHFYADSLHYYPSRSQERLEKMLKVGETFFYHDIKPFKFSVGMKQYFEDMYHLSDSEIASYNGNFDYAIAKLNKIIDPTIKDFCKMYIIKNTKKDNKLCVASSIAESVENTDLKKWFGVQQQ